jgi:hypothetical protein
VRKDLCGPRVVVMEWIDGIRCTDVPGIQSTVNVDEFIRWGRRGVERGSRVGCAWVLAGGVPGAGVPK